MTSPLSSMSSFLDLFTVEGPSSSAVFLAFPRHHGICCCFKPDMTFFLSCGCLYVDNGCVLQVWS
jgi:hypothetical protein